jgi:hypothetical protein
MSSIAEFVLPADEFPLGATFEVAPEATLELDRVVPLGDTVMPFFWVTVPDGDLERVRERLAGLTELRSVAILETIETRGLFEAEWEPAFIGIMGAIEQAELTVLSASGSADGWTFELRAHDDSAFTVFQEACAEQDIPVSLRRLQQLLPPSNANAEVGAGYGLTTGQREALVLAYERGYYDSPGDVTLSALGEELGITGQSVGSRLRRGTSRLIDSTLADGS